MLCVRFKEKNTKKKYWPDLKRTNLVTRVTESRRKQWPKVDTTKSKKQNENWNAQLGSTKAVWQIGRATQELYLQRRLIS